MIRKEVKTKRLILRPLKLSDYPAWFGVFEKKSGQLIGAIDFDIFIRSTHQFANFGS